MYKITETTAYYPLSVLLRESGLEVEISNNAPEETLKMWKCEDEETGELLAAAVLQYKSYCYVLENLAVKPLDPDYLGVTAAEYWIGILFPAGTAAPEGFQALHIPAGDYALHYLYGKEDAPDMYGSAALRLCAQAMEAQGMTQAPGAVMERYNCPRFTTPDAEGNVIIDYLVPIQ